MRARLLPGLLAAALLAGCVGVVSQPQAEVRSLKGAVARGAETQVSVDRLKANLAVLTGKAAFKEGATIPERGTADGRGLTRQFLTATLESYGYTVEKHRYRNNGENVFVRLQADTPTTETILVGAHMDSVKNAGANDNGTGTVAVLETARVLKDLKNRKVNVIFAWFDEEELGLVGSYAMARDFNKNGVKLQSVHTIDMMGWDKDGDKAVEIERPDGNLWEYYKMVNETHGLNLKLTRTNSGSTDHVAFRDEGFTAVGMCEEWAGGDTTPHYHKKSDTFETIDFEFLASSTRLMAAAIGDLSLKVPGPANVKRLPHSAFPGRDRHFHGNGHNH